jgi:hypothetical protein
MQILDNSDRPNRVIIVGLTQCESLSVYRLIEDLGGEAAWTFEYIDCVVHFIDPRDTEIFKVMIGDIKC